MLTFCLPGQYISSMTRQTGFATTKNINIYYESSERFISCEVWFGIYLFHSFKMLCNLCNCMLLRKKHNASPPCGGGINIPCENQVKCFQQSQLYHNLGFNCPELSSKFHPRIPLNFGHCESIPVLLLLHQF